MNVIEENQCCGCESCYNACPHDAIVMHQNEKGMYIPTIDSQKCKSCEICKLVCPVMKSNNEHQYNIKAYACYNKNLAERMKSTSGGVFYLLAKYIIKEHHGIVYGAAFTKEFHVKHIGVESLSDITKLQGSKYVQSKIGNCYREIKEHLCKGRVVLFSGLPCQVEGLYAYLKKRHERLYCVDMACYGVPSSGVWERYLEEFYPKKDIKDIVFKDKISGWKNWNVKIVRERKTEYFLKSHNLYMNSFLSGINVRDSCFACKFKGLRRISDITIADCWGIGEQNEVLNDDKGLSAVLVQSAMGEKLFDKIMDELEYQEYEASLLMKGNWAMNECSTPHAEREEFFKELRKHSLKRTLYKYCKLPWKIRIKYIIQKMKKEFP